MGADNLSPDTCLSGLSPLSQVHPYLASVARLTADSGRSPALAVLAHSDLCLPAAWCAPERGGALAGVGALDDVPVACWFMAHGEAEDRFERDMAEEATIIAEDELVEIRVDMFAAQAAIGAEAPPLSLSWRLIVDTIPYLDQPETTG